MSALAFIHMPSGMEWIIVLVIALLIFGRKLPDVGRSLGRGIVEFKKGLKGMQDEMQDVEKDLREAERQAELDSDHAARLANEQGREKVEEKSASSVGERSDDSRHS